MRSCLLPLCALLSAYSAAAQISILTGQVDISRSGANTHEVLLSPLSVGSGNFEQLLSLPVNGRILTQPLYVSGVQIGSDIINLLVVTSLLDDVYAFDADSGLEIWHITLLDAAHGAGPDAIYNSGIPGSAIGIAGTPVIDSNAGTIYLVGKTWESGRPILRLHALDLLTGSEKIGGPATLQATVAGTGWESTNGQVSFDANAEYNRAGLLLLNGIVYAAFSAAHEPGNWHGWMLAYNATSLQQTGVWNTTPNAAGSGIWMAGTALAAEVIDPANHPFGRMFVATGNGTYDNNGDFGDDIINLDLTAGVPTPQDSFTPANQATLNASDLDLGSGGVVILPDSVGSAQHPHLLVQASKSGNIFLVDRDNMGGYQASDAVVQELNSGLAFEGMFGSPAYWNGSLYFGAANDYLKSFSIAGGYILPTPTSMSPAVAPYSGSTPSISANGNSNGIVWTLGGAEGTAASLQAFDAANLGSLLFSSDTNPSRDGPGFRTKFSVPTVVNGKVYVGADSKAVIFGSMFTVAPLAASIVASAGATGTSTISVASPAGSTFVGTVNLSITGLPAGVSAGLSANTVTLSQSPFTGFSTLTLTIDSAVANGSYPFQVLGTNGILQSSTNLILNVSTGPYPVLSDSLVSFSQSIGATSSTYTVSLTNSGSADLAISSLSIRGTNAPDFSMTTSCGTDLPPGATCPVSIAFSPRKGNETATLSIIDNAGGFPGSTQTVLLIGNGLGPSVTITPSLAFGVQALATASSGYPVTLRNNGTAALAIAGTTVTGNNRADFIVSPVSTCGASLSPSTSCTILIVFTPSIAANESAVLIVTDDAGNVTGSTQAVTLTGAGSAPLATLSAGSLTFPAQTDGVKSAPLTVQLTNTGTSTLLLQSIVFSGPNAADFSATNCGNSLTAGKSCAIAVYFLPSTAGPESAILTLSDNSGGIAGSTQAINLNGIGFGVPSVSLTASLSFGAQTVGLPSSSLAATLKNTGTGSLSIAGMTLTGANASDFALSNTANCGTMLAAGASCSIAVTFTASMQTGESAFLTITDNAGNVAGTVQSVALSGTGTAPGGFATASYLGADITTKGAWTGIYGANGAIIPNAITNVPSYATFTVANASPFTWAASTTDSRALQISSGSSARIASTYVSSASTVFDVNIPDGSKHQIAIYLLDWSNSGRAETLTITDGDSGALLSTQSFSAFQSGIWARWNISRHIKIKLTVNSGPNALVSGLFFDPITATAAYKSLDTTTKGTWTGTYGSNGVVIANDLNLPPSYASVSVTNGNPFTWAAATSDVRAPQASSGSSTRIAAAFVPNSSTVFDVNITDGLTHRLAMYLLDWSSGGRAETIKIADAGSGMLLDSRAFSAFQNGQYASWNISGHIKVTVTANSGANALVSGLFFDPVGATATYKSLDVTTKGTWSGKYGSNGVVIANDLNLPPSYAIVNVTNGNPFTWTATTADLRAPQVSSGSSARIAAAFVPGSSTVFDVNITDGLTHSLAMYLLDWSSGGRVETVKISDAGSGTLLDSRTFSAFQNGQYGIWNISGHVKVAVIANSGANALLSGLFFDSPAQ